MTIPLLGVLSSYALFILLLKMQNIGSVFVINV